MTPAIASERSTIIIRSFPCRSIDIILRYMVSESVDSINRDERGFH